MLEERLKLDAAKPCTCVRQGWHKVAPVCNSCEAREELDDVRAKLGAVRKI